MRSAGSAAPIALRYASSKVGSRQPASFCPDSETMVLEAKNTTESLVPQYVVYSGALSQVTSQNTFESCFTTLIFTSISRAWVANSVADSARPAMSSVVTRS